MGRHSRLNAESKMAIVLEGLKGERSVAEICREHGISQALYYRWRDGLLEGGRERLNGKKAGGGEAREAYRQTGHPDRDTKKNGGVVRDRVRAVTVLRGSGFYVGDACQANGPGGLRLV